MPGRGYPLIRLWCALVFGAGSLLLLAISVEAGPPRRERTVHMTPRLSVPSIALRPVARPAPTTTKTAAKRPLPKKAPAKAHKAHPHPRLTRSRLPKTMILARLPRRPLEGLPLEWKWFPR